MPVLSTMTEWELHTALNEIDTLREVLDLIVEESKKKENTNEPG